MSTKPVDAGPGPGAASDRGVSPAPEAVEIPAAERARLFGLARLAVSTAVRREPLDALREALAGAPLPTRPGAAFVTLTEGGELRGCMGCLEEAQPAWRNVLDAARLAALGDPRFEPVAPRELARVHIEVSVLGPMTPLPDPAGFRPGMDGIVVEQRGRRALLLPEVADMLDPVPSAMLDAVCRKAGLAPDAWQDPRTALAVFRTCRFGGPADPYDGAHAEEGG